MNEEEFPVDPMILHAGMDEHFMNGIYYLRTRSNGRFVVRFTRYQASVPQSNGCFKVVVEVWNRKLRKWSAHDRCAYGQGAWWMPAEEARDLWISHLEKFEQFEPVTGHDIDPYASTTAKWAKYGVDAHVASYDDYKTYNKLDAEERAWEKVIDRMEENYNEWKRDSGYALEA